MLYSEISLEDRQALWLAFEKRFPLGLEKEFLLQEANLTTLFDVSVSWSTIFDQLEHKPRAFKRLFQSAVDMRPDDSNLLEVAKLLTPETSATWFIGVASAISVAILATVVLPMEESGNVFDRTDRNTAAHAQILQQTHISPSVTPIVTPIAEPIQLMNDGVEEQHTRQGLSHLEADVDFATTKPSNQVQQPQNEGHISRCTFEGNGEIIGYWYAGDNKPDVQNGWTTISFGRNVRADYPEKHNGYNARAQINCVLFDNTSVPVQDEPILVAGDKYWIPLRSISKG